MASFKLNKTYNFTTLAPAILGETFKNMKVKAILTADEAIKYRDIMTLHNQLKTKITALPISVSDYSGFILFENSSGEAVLLADEYIDTYSVTEVKNITIQIVIPDADTTDVNVLRTRLLELGYVKAQITTY